MMNVMPSRNGSYFDIGTPQADEFSTLVRNPKFPKYSSVRDLMKVIKGCRKQDVRAFLNAKSMESGERGAPVSWKNPDQWMSDRLTGVEKEIAERVWFGTERRLNPASIYGSYLLIVRYHLLGSDEGTLTWTERSSLFQKQSSSVIFEVDFYEGVREIIEFLSAGDATKSDLREHWRNFCFNKTNIKSERSIDSTLSLRLTNCRERDLIKRSNENFSLCEIGLEYLTKALTNKTSTLYTKV